MSKIKVKTKITCRFKDGCVNVKFSPPPPTMKKYGVTIHTDSRKVVLAPNGYYFVTALALDEAWFPLGKTELVERDVSHYVELLKQFIPELSIQTYKNGTVVCSFEAEGLVDSFMWE